MKKKKNILKEAGVLLIVALMTLSTTTVMANTYEVQLHESGLITTLDTLLFENFDGTWTGSPPTPAGWTQYCTNPNAEIWQPNTVRYVSPPNSAYRGGFGSSLLSDDWLVSPEINAAGYSNINLSWWERHGWLGYYSNYCGLWISCGSPNPADQDYVLIMERPPPDDTVGIWISYYVILDTYLTDDTFYIAWEYDKTSTGMTSCWNIDDVEILGEEIPVVPAICCDGSLYWEEVEPGGTVTGEFEVCNCGDPGSLLNWQFDSAPSWPGAVWEIEPDSGSGLAKDDCVTITVNVTAPPDENTEFTGKIKMINSDNPSDYCEIDVYLKTPRNKAFNMNLPFLRFLEQHPHMFPILRHLLRL